MEFLDVIQKRYSVRSYRGNPVEEQKLQQLLEAAQLAPTAANRQPFQLIIKKRLRKPRILMLGMNQAY